MLPPDPADRLHNQHPPTTRSHPGAGSLPTTMTRGSKLDADHPATGVNVPRRITHYLSNGRREGRYWLIGDVTNTPGRSLFVRLKGPDSGKGAAGKWTDATTGENGDLLDLIAANRRLDRLPAVLDEARSFLSLPRPEPDHSERMSPAPAGSPESARRLFAMAQPLPAQSPKPICADAALRLCTAPEPCASTHAATIGRMPRPRPRPGRR